MNYFSIGDIIIKKEDMSTPYSYISYHTTKERSEEKKEGWRLPTFEESKYFRELYDLGIGNFKKITNEYLTSIILGKDQVEVFDLHLNKGKFFYRDTPCWVRLVKDKIKKN